MAKARSYAKRYCFSTAGEPDLGYEATYDGVDNLNKTDILLMLGSDRKRAKRDLSY